jgi:hypothetical protein
MSRIKQRLLVLFGCTLIALGSVAFRPPLAQPAAPTVADGSPATAEMFATATPQSVPMPAGPLVMTNRQALLQPHLLRQQILDREELGIHPSGRSRRIAAASAPTAASAPVRLAGDGPLMPGNLVIQTERLDFYVGKQTFNADQVAALAPLIEQLLRDNEARFGTTLRRRVSVAFYRVGLAPGRGVRGMAYTDEGRTEVFYRPNESVERAATVAAHELAHHLEAQRYGAAVQRRADTILHEGLATWIVGDRWLAMCGGESWKARVRALRDAGIPLRLLTAERSGANNAYEVWASFVDFLIERYGRDKLDALYRSGRGRAPGTSDYGGVLGTSLDELADAWREWVDS